MSGGSPVVFAAENFHEADGVEDAYGGHGDHDDDGAIEEDIGAGAREPGPAPEDGGEEAEGEGGAAEALLV